VNPPGHRRRQSVAAVALVLGACLAGAVRSFNMALHPKAANAAGAFAPPAAPIARTSVRPRTPIAGWPNPPSGTEWRVPGMTKDWRPPQNPSIETVRALIPYLEQPVLLLRADAQWGLALRIVDAKFDSPAIGHRFSGSFTVENIGVSYRVSDLSVRPPSFALFIYRDDQLLFHNTGTWAPKQHDRGVKIPVQWQTQGSAAKIPFLVVPGPGRYRCRIELYAGQDHQRLIDDWETAAEVH
jgi:hypothetical protein